jgi:hypothetical protein
LINSFVPSIRTFLGSLGSLGPLSTIAFVGPANMHHQPTFLDLMDSEDDDDWDSDDDDDDDDTAASLLAQSYFDPESMAGLVGNGAGRVADRRRLARAAVIPRLAEAPGGFSRTPEQGAAMGKVVCPNCKRALVVEGEGERQVWLVKGCGHVGFYRADRVWWADDGYRFTANSV